MGIQLDRVINENYEKLNTVDQHILQFVQANLESCKKMNIADLARHCSVSTATILRTAQKLNFSGYSEFKYFLRSDSAENAEDNVSSTAMHNTAARFITPVIFMHLPFL